MSSGFLIFLNIFFMRAGKQCPEDTGMKRCGFKEPAPQGKAFHFT